jgi:Cu-Zn family superoxide dismutase
MKNRLIVLAAGATVFAGAVAAANAADAQSRSAKANLTTAAGVRIGSVTFKSEDGLTNVRVRLTGAPGIDAFHGFHIHANDVPGNGDGCIADPLAAASTWFVSADGHYNPAGAAHAHHAGDLPVVYVNGDGTVETRFSIDRIKLSDLDGKVVVLHAGPDNYNHIPLGDALAQYTANSADATTATARTGNAGDRIACGVISTR